MFSKIRRLIALVATLSIIAVVSGCAESSRPQASGKGNVRGINAIVTAPEISFLIERRNIGSVNFKATTGFNTYDNLSYNFNFDLLLPDVADANRLGSQFVDVLADHEYTVVLMGSIASPSTVSWEDPIRVWSETETVFEVFFAHLAPSMGELDIYFAAPGTVPVLGQAVGSVTSGTRLPLMELDAVQYELIVTPKDDPATIIYQSAALTTVAQSRVMIAVFDPDPSVPGNVAVTFFDQAGLSLGISDVNFPPQLRTLHTAFGTGSFDGYFDSDFVNAIYSDIAFQELSPYADVLNATTLLTLTPVGNSGATIHAGDVSATAGSKRTIVLAGAPGALAFLNLLDDSRTVETFPLLRIINASVNTDVVDIYMLEPGTPIEDAIIPQVFGLPSLVNTGYNARPAGMLELTVTLAGEKTPISAPVIIDMSDGDVFDIAVFDTVDPAILELVVIDSQLAP